MRYKVIEATNEKALEVKVEKFIGDGWKLQGGVNTSDNEYGKFVFRQAMTSNNMSYPSATNR